MKEQKDVIRKPIPIKKVRVKYVSNAMQEYKSNIYNQKAFVEPGENYCIAIYGNEGETKEFKTVSFLEAVRKIKTKKLKV